MISLLAVQTGVLGEFQAQKQAGVFPSVPAPMQGKLLLVQVLLCSILSPHHALCTVHSNSRELSFLHRFSVSPPSFTYCQQPSWVLEDVLESETQPSNTAVTSDTWDLALQPALLLSVPGPCLGFPANSAVLPLRTMRL